MRLFLGLTVWFIILSALVFTSCNFIRKYYKADNPLEEFVEDVIEEKSGWKLDLSPWDPEEEKGKEKENARNI